MIGTPAEERFDRLTRIARKLFGVESAMVDIVGDKLNWLKSAQGIDAVGPPRALSFCQYTILQSDHEPCLIEDSRTDPRVADLGSVFRFYAGVPLRHENENVGVFCIADREPRTMTPEDLTELRGLAELAERELQIVALSQAQIGLAIEADELEAKALIDPLTRAWNRGAICEIAARELQRGIHEQTPTGLIMLDVDHFKRINDTHGHQAGDEVLRQVPERIRGAVRQLDAVGRYGGEEFLIVLPNCGEADVTAIADRVRLHVGLAPVEYGSTLIPVTASLGATVSRDGGHFVEMLIRAADLALYKAKREGRDRVCMRSVTPSLTIRR